MTGKQMAEWTKRFSLEGRRALVTGATKGIGFEACRVLADAGADIATRHPRGDVRIDREEVVLTDEQHRQALQRGKIDALVKDAFVGCALTEKRNHHDVPLLHLGGVIATHVDAFDDRRHAATIARKKR